MTYFRRVFLVHVEEMRHHRLDDGLAAVIRLHCHDAAKDFERPTIPIFENIVMCCESGIDESAQILADGLTTMPIRDTEVADRILGKAIEPFAKRLIVN